MGDLDAGEQARFLYLLVLLLALASGLLALYRGRLGAALQNVAIWVLIFLGLILAYGLRDQIGLAMFDDRPAIADADTVVLRRARDGHFHARVEVNGREIEFLVDTGATGIVLGPADARRAGFDLSTLDYTVEARTANGLVRAAPVRIGTLRLGPFEDRDVRALVNGADLDRSLLGMDYLDRFASVRFEGDRLTLER